MLNPANKYLGNCVLKKDNFSHSLIYVFFPQFIRLPINSLLDGLGLISTQYLKQDVVFFS